MWFVIGLYSVCKWFTSASEGLLGEVSGPAHGPQVVVVQLADRARTPDLIAPSVLEELIRASSQRGQSGAVRLSEPPQEQEAACPGYG
jgi:hypothetical protein